jgi:hypothetical protein
MRTIQTAESLEWHVLSAERLHGDDTTVPVLANMDPEDGRLTVLGPGEEAITASRTTSR